MSTDARDGHRLVALAPALVVAFTALFAMPGFAGGYRLAKWGAFGAALAALAGALLLCRGPLRMPRQWWWPTLFVGVAAVFPAFASPSPTHWPTWLGLLTGLALFMVTSIAQDDDDGARRASYVVLIATGVACTLLVLLQTAGLRWLTSETYTDIEFRAPGTFGNPNWAAAFLASIVPLALALAATAERRRLYFGAAILLTAGTVATLSKGGVLTLVGGVLVFVLLDRAVRARTRLALLGIAMVSTVVAVASAWSHDVFENATWLRGRVFLWRCALQLVGEQPFTGVGLGGYPPAYGRAAAAVIDGDAAAFMPLSAIDFAHNDVLQLASEAGLPTVLALVVVLVSAMTYAYRRGDAWSRGAAATIAAIVVNGLADAPFHVPSTFVLLFFALGCLAPAALVSRSTKPMLAAIVVLGALEGTRFTAGNVYWTLARTSLRSERPDAVASFERARVFMPEHGRSASQYAKALVQAGRIDDAIEALHVAATLRFDFDDEVFRRDLQMRGLDHDGAIRLWRELTSRFPALIVPHLRLGGLYMLANDRAAAIDAFQTVLAIPQDTERAKVAKDQAREMMNVLTP